MHVVCVGGSDAGISAGLRRPVQFSV